MNGGGYNSYCRMPGLLPIYAPLRLIFSEPWAKTLIIILQFLTGVLSVYILAKTAEMVFNNYRIFLITFFLYAFSSFVSIWDHYGLSDSFGVSFLIFSSYYLVKYKNCKNIKYLLFSGLFITWSLFFRPVHGILIPFMILFFILNKKQILISFKHSFLFSLPIIIALGIWTSTNYYKHHKVVILQGPSSECFGALTKELLAVRKLIIAWGGDYQPWSKGAEAEWFFTKNVDYKTTSPSKNNIYTSLYTIDSLRILKEEYFNCYSDSFSKEKNNINSQALQLKCERYLKSYINEHSFNYYFFKLLP